MDGHAPRWMARRDLITNLRSYPRREVLPEVHHVLNRDGPVIGALVHYLEVCARQ